MGIFAFARRVAGAQVSAFTFCASHRSPSSRAPTHAPGSTRRGFACNPSPQLFSSMTMTVNDPKSSEVEEYDWDILLPFEKHTHNSIKIAVPEACNGEADPYDASTLHSKLEATLATATRL